MKSMIGLLVVVVIVILVYQFYFSKSQSPGVSTPAQTINAVGAKNDLLSMAQAERAYQAEHGAYATLDQLLLANALTIQNRQRENYTYDAQVTSDGFRVTARCVVPSGCTNYFVDQTMEVQPLR